MKEMILEASRVHQWWFGRPVSLGQFAVRRGCTARHRGGPLISYEEGELDELAGRDAQMPSSILYVTLASEETPRTLAVKILEAYAGTQTSFPLDAVSSASEAKRGARNLISMLLL